MNDIFEKKLDNLIDEAMPFVVEKISADIPDPTEKYKFSLRHEAAMNELFAKKQKKTWLASYSKYVSYAAAALLFIVAATTITTTDFLNRNNDVENDMPPIDVQGIETIIERQDLTETTRGAEYEEEFHTTDIEMRVLHLPNNQQRQHYGESQTTAPITENIPEINETPPVAATSNQIQFLQPIIVPPSPEQPAPEQTVEPQAATAEVLPDEWVAGRMAGGGVGSSDSLFNLFVDYIDMEASMAVQPLGIGIDNVFFVQVGNIQLGYMPFGFMLDYSIVSENLTRARFVSGNLYFTIEAGEHGSEIVTNGNVSAETLEWITESASWIY